MSRPDDDTAALLARLLRRAYRGTRYDITERIDREHLARVLEAREMMNRYREWRAA